MCCGYQGDGENKREGEGNSKGINGKAGRNVLYGSLGMDSRDLVAAEYADALFTRIRYYCASPVGKRSIVTSVSVCLSVCLSVLAVSLRAYLRNCTAVFSNFCACYLCGSILWRRCDTLCTSGSMDDVIVGGALVRALVSRVVGCWRGLEQGADLHTGQLMPLPLTVSCFSKI